MTCTATSRRSRRCSRTPGDVDRFVLGGDYALFGGWPLETIERLRELPALWIRGNGERWTARPRATRRTTRSCPRAIEAARAALGAQLVADLASLPASAAERDTLICHALTATPTCARSSPSPPTTSPSCSTA